ncbi:hypothetical protein R1flu_003479 [Riccia fluitans]|uniref:Uncharacterized protein n=1 Tax=Riccia fluitans TaxID=41844 RepID=A0ABD1YA41_9MARC
MDGWGDQPVLVVWRGRGFRGHIFQRGSDSLLLLSSFSPNPRLPCFNLGPQHSSEPAEAISVARLCMIPKPRNTGFAAIRRVLRTACDKRSSR